MECKGVSTGLKCGDGEVHAIEVVPGAAGGSGDFHEVLPVEVAGVEARLGGGIGEALGLPRQHLEALGVAGESQGVLLGVGSGLGGRAQLLDLSQDFLGGAGRFLGGCPVLAGWVFGLDGHGVLLGAGGLRWVRAWGGAVELWATG